MIKHSTFPAFGDGFPHGKVTGAEEQQPPRRGWTEIGLGAAALVLLINTGLPRMGGIRDDDHDDVERPS